MIIPVNLGEKSYDIYLERGIIGRAAELLDLNRKVLVVTDSGVPAEYAQAICNVCKDSYLVTIAEGEDSKNLETFAMLCQSMLEHGFSRKDCVVAVGGGVVGDLAGFAAACFMRGIDFYNVPTTLLSQVDSSVGGKTAVDFCGIKNIIGAFHQPKAVLIDPDVLKTLDRRQFACGSAEMIKMAATFDEELFGLIEENRIEDILEDVISRVVKIKAMVVEADEKEAGLRKVLNFGHTIGHGIESVTDLLHGECVAIGMIPMTAPDVRDRLKALLQREDLPVACKANIDEVVMATMHDKKAEGGQITTIVVDKIGTYRFEKKDEDELAQGCKEVLL